MIPSNIDPKNCRSLQIFFSFLPESCIKEISRFSSLVFSKKHSLKQNPLISLGILKKTHRSTVLCFELTRTDSAIGVPFDFKVNTPLKSHQSKIESLTVARGLFYIQSNNGHRHPARCVHTPYVNKDGNMTEIPRMAVTGREDGPTGAQVGNGRSGIERISIDTNRVSRGILSLLVAGKIHAFWRSCRRYHKNNRPIVIATRAPQNYHPQTGLLRIQIIETCRRKQCRRKCSARERLALGRRNNVENLSPLFYFLNDFELRPRNVLYHSTIRRGNETALRRSNLKSVRRLCRSSTKRNQEFMCKHSAKRWREHARKIHNDS